MKSFVGMIVHERMHKGWCHNEKAAPQTLGSFSDHHNLGGSSGALL